MASIEQDDLFNVEDEEDMEDEELDVPQQEDYAMDIDEQQPKEEDNQDEDEEMIEAEYDEDQEGEEDEEEDEDEDGEEEEEEEGEGEGEGEGEEEEDEDEEDEDDEEEEDEEEGDQSTANVSTAITSPRSKEQDDSKLLPEEPEGQDQLPSTLIEENKDSEGDILLGEQAKEDSQRPESQPVEPEPKPQEPEKPQEKQPEEKEDDKEQPVEVAQSQSQPQPQPQPPSEDKEKQPTEPSQDDKSAPDLPQPPSQAAPEQVQSQPPTTEEAKDKEHLIDDIKDSESDLTFRERIIAKARRATEFDIIPQVAIPYTSQCHSLAFTEGPKWILTGGEDGFVRKYDFIASIQGKSPLTMAQKHNLLSDSLTNAGVICSYWENEQPLTRKQLMRQNPKLKDSDFSTGSVSYEPKVNPVYALDAERNGYWCLSGLLSGGISLYTMRYNEGTIHHYFHHGSKENRSRGHNDAVSVLKLNQEQDKFLSGSWDKTIREWDLNTGKTVIEYAGSSGQISNISFRPNGLSDITFTIQEPEQPPQSQGNKDNNDDIDSLFGSDDEDQDMDDKTTEDDRKAKESVTTTHAKPGASSTTHRNSNIFMSSSIDGTINIWDVRTANPVIRLGVSEGTPPWCMSSSWSNNGDFIYAGRRNSTIEEISIKMPHARSNAGHHTDTMVPNVSKLLAFPKISGPVSALSTMPNDDFLLCGSNDNIRLYNLKLYDDLNNEKFNVKKQATPFLIIPGHHGGMLSSLYVDETGRFMVSASGYRGWGHGAFTDSVLIYEIDFE